MTYIRLPILDLFVENLDRIVELDEDKKNTVI
jgi:hypothetical protein